MITGNNLLGGNIVSNEYYFSNFYSIWGWATWKRSWATYDVNIQNWPNSFIKNYLKYNFSKKLAKYYESSFDLIKNNNIDTWDHQWTYNCIINSGFCITPRANLVTNIGVIGTHSPKLSENHFIPFGVLDIQNLKHPSYNIIDYDADLNFTKLKIKNTSFLKSNIIIVLKKMNLYKVVKKIING